MIEINISVTQLLNTEKIYTKTNGFKYFLLYTFCIINGLNVFLIYRNRSENEGKK